MTDAFAAYSHATASLALWGLLMTVLMLMSTAGRTPENRTESGLVKRNYADPAYRRHRAFANAIETTGPFIAVTVAAILTGANPFWVNLLASVFVVARIVMAVIHIATRNQPARSAAFGVGLLCILGLAGLAVVAAFH